jgi:hypothetical protein
VIYGIDSQTIPNFATTGSEIVTDIVFSYNEDDAVFTPDGANGEINILQPGTYLASCSISWGSPFSGLRMLALEWVGNFRLMDSDNSNRTYAYAPGSASFNPQVMTVTGTIHYYDNDGTQKVVISVAHDNASNQTISLYALTVTQLSSGSLGIPS